MDFSKWKIFVACALALGLNVGLNENVLAAEEAEVETKNETIVVTAGRVEENIKTVTQSMTIIPREELDKNQHQDLGEMLKHYGLDVQGGGSANSSFSRVAIRGLQTPSSGQYGNDNTSYVLILLDGRRMPTSNVSMIPMMGIERVEILRGPGALQYGSQAMGGVINIITKRGTKDLHISAEAGYGSWETTQGMGSITGMLGPVDFAGSISSLQQADDYKAGNDRVYSNTSVSNRTSYLLNLGVNFLDEHRLGVSFTGMENNEMGSPFYPRERAMYPTDHTPKAETERSDYSWNVNYEGGYKDWGLKWNAQYFKGYSHYTYDDNDGNVYWIGWTPYNGGAQRHEIDTQGAQAQISWDSKFLTLTGGGEWYNYDYRPTIYGEQKNNMESNNISGFILAKVKLFDDQIILNGGLRYDDYILSYQGKDKKIDNTSYSLGARWNALDWLSFKANYGTSFKMPNAQQLAGYRYDTIVYLGNPNLDPERGRGWDAGFEINYKSAKLELNYFENEIEDQIFGDSVSIGTARKFINRSGSSLYRGLEGNASIDLGEFFEWPFQLRPYASFTHLFQNEDSAGETIRYVRNLDMAFGLNFNYPEIGLTADLRFIYLGQMMERDYVNYGKDRRTGGDTTVDFYITKTIWDWEEGGKLSIKGSVKNLMNVNYDTYYGYPSPGRSFYIGLRYDF